MTDSNRVDEFDVSVEETERGWQVVAVVDGERKAIDQVYPDRESAEFAARHIESATDRWTDAATVAEPDPDQFPDDGATRSAQ